MPYGEVPTELSLKAFVQERLAPKAVIKDAFFVATLEGRFIGMSSLWAGEGYLETEFTGVLPEYRGRGVAKLMKLRGIGYAVQHGYGEIRTTNDERNHAMRAVNEHIGFRPQSVLLRFEKKVTA